MRPTRCCAFAVRRSSISVTEASQISKRRGATRSPVMPDSANGSTRWRYASTVTESRGRPRYRTEYAPGGPQRPPLFDPVSSRQERLTWRSKVPATADLGAAATSSASFRATLGRSRLKPQNRVDDRFEVSVDQQVDGSPTVKLRVARVQPYLDPLRPIDVIELAHDEVDVDEPVTGFGCRARGPSGPVLDLSLSNSSDSADLGRRQAVPPDLLDQRRKREPGRRCPWAHTHHRPSSPTMTYSIALWLRVI